MKKTFLFSCLISFLTSASQNTERVQVLAPVKSVILYLDGAEVSQSKQLNLNPGRTIVTFTGLSPKLISKSIQVNVGADVNVLSVSDKINFLSEGKESPRFKQIKDSIEMINDLNTQLQWQIDAYNSEKNMLAKNESIGGQDKGVNPVDLKSALDLYRARLKEINSEMFTLTRKQNKLNQSLLKLNQQLGENGETEMPTAEISILVNSASRTTTTVDLRYVVKESGWAPGYDLISEDINKPIELKYRAKVYNNSGIDWNDVKIKLSTSDPMRSATQPEMNPWFLNFSNIPYANNIYGGVPAQYNNEGMKDIALQQQSVSQTPSLYEKELGNAFQSKSEKQKRNQPAAIEYEEVQVSELSAEFDIKQNYTIPADAKPYIVDVITYNLNANFQYYSVPKIEKEAFMLARITGWEELDLVEGPANVYLGGTFVGQSYINTRSVDDTLSLSFGRDKKIVVTRTKLKDFNKETSAGSNRKITYSYEMIVKNNHKAPVQIELEDQLPVSQSSEIIVDAIELSKAEVNASTGQLKWKLSLAPDESKKIILTYSVKYPKNKNINLYKSKAKYRAKL